MSDGEIWSWVKSPIARHIGLVALLIVIVVGGQKYYNKEGESLADKWFKNITNEVRLLEINKATPKELRGNDIAVKRINDQLNDIRGRIDYQTAILKHIYARYYMLVIIATVTTIIAGIFLLVITKSGWDKASSYIITIFLVMAGFAISHTAFINIFSIDKNIANNKAIYTYYISLKNEILSYIDTGEDSDGKKVDLVKYIHNIDNKMAKIDSVAISFDATKIPDYKKVVKELKQ